MKVEATGNTKEQAINALDLKKLELTREEVCYFGGLRSYGNSEIGYKVVQDYTTAL